MTTCRYCGDEVYPWTCPKCEATNITFPDCCGECHAELAHGIIRNQNIHIVGGTDNPKLNGLDADPDAFGKAWRAGN